MSIIFDLETGPLPEDQIFQVVDAFQPPPPVGEFDPSAVKYGNIKDEEKRAAKLQNEMDKHAKEVANYVAKNTKLEAEHKANALDKAPLDPMTGQILAIGYQSEKGCAIQTIGDPASESELIAAFWTRYRSCRSSGRKLIGHNIFAFDLPFLVRRSWILGVDVPSTVIEHHRYWDQKTFTDTMQVWACGKYNEWTKLDRLSKIFGGNGKPEGIDGSMFHVLFAGSPEDRTAAIEYLKNDLEMTAKVAERMGVI